MESNFTKENNMSMSGIMPRRDLHLEQIEAFNALPPFPDGAHSWGEFITPYKSVVKETPFAITLRKGPEAKLYNLSLPFIGGVYEYIFFGLLTSRVDGKLGRLCFGQESKDFGGNDTLGRIAIFVRDGFDAQFLKTRQQKDGFFVPNILYKVTAMDTKFDSVMSKLGRSLARIIGEDKSCPNEIVSANLGKIRRHLNAFLPLCGEFGHTHEIDFIIQSIDERLGMRVTQLEKEKKDLEDLLSGIKREINLLSLFRD